MKPSLKQLFEKRMVEHKNNPGNSHWENGYESALDDVQAKVDKIVEALKHISDYSSGEFGWSELAESALAEFYKVEEK
jgi:hypothetical protein